MPKGFLLHILKVFCGTPQKIIISSLERANLVQRREMLGREVSAMDSLGGFQPYFTICKIKVFFFSGEQENFSFEDTPFTCMNFHLNIFSLA